MRVGERVVPEDCPRCHPARLTAPAATPPTARMGSAAGVDVLSALADAGVNVWKYRDATLESFDPAEDPVALEVAREFVEHWRGTFGERYAYRPWMYLYGDGSRAVEARGRKEAEIGKTGNGKTHLPIGIARRLLQEGLLPADRLVFVEMEEILMRSEATIRGGEDSEEKLVGRYSAPELLIIDDCFIRPPTNHSMRLMLRILNRRAGRGTILTSNVSLKTASALDTGMARLVDRIMDECGDGGRFVVPFKGRSHRADRVLGLRKPSLQSA